MQRYAGGEIPNLCRAPRPTYAAQTVDRALTVLHCFTSSNPVLSGQEISSKMGLPYSTLYRYLVTLQSAGYLARDSRTGLYSLGLRLVEQAGIVLNQLDVRLHALSELDALADEVGLTANLAILFEGDTFHIGFAVRTKVRRGYTTIGRRAVAHCTALGKCLLSDLPRDEVHRSIKERGWRPYTEKSIQSFEALDRELDAIAAQGYTIDREERARNLWCVAAPIYDHSGRIVAAMSVSGSKQTLQGENLQRVIDSVVRHAGRVSYSFGHESVLMMEP